MLFQYESTNYIKIFLLSSENYKWSSSYRKYFTAFSKKSLLWSWWKWNTFVQIMPHLLHISPTLIIAQNEKSSYYKLCKIKDLHILNMFIKHFIDTNLYVYFLKELFLRFLKLNFIMQQCFAWALLCTICISFTFEVRLWISWNGTYRQFWVTMLLLGV